MLPIGCYPWGQAACADLLPVAPSEARLEALPVQRDASLGQVVADLFEGRVDHVVNLQGNVWVLPKISVILNKSVITKPKQKAPPDDGRCRHRIRLMTDEEINRKIAGIAHEIEELFHVYVDKGMKPEKAIRKIFQKVHRKFLLGDLVD